MSIQHKNISEADLHESKGVSTALVDTVYIADGAGSGAWSKIDPTQLKGISTNGVSGDLIGVDGAGNYVLVTAPHGQISFYDLASPSVVTYPSTYTKVSPTTVASGTGKLITEGTDAKLTYTGTASVPLTFHYSVSLDQASGADRDVIIALYKNGTIVDARSVVTTQTGKKLTLVGTNTMIVATNDYFELYVLNNGASGDVNIYAYQLSAIIAGA